MENNLANYIDHTLLAPDATTEAIKKLCAEANEYGFASVCVQPYRVAQAAAELAHTDIMVCTVVGFPHGANGLAKVREAEIAVAHGAEEIDMVINIGAAKDGDWDIVTGEIRAVKEKVGALTVKVILETCLLTKDEIRLACQAAMAAGADFVKTSTGFAGGGATVEDVRLMRETVGTNMGVKASGGIRDRETAMAMLAAGANRLGASSGVKICAKE